ncbi:hypothetical protein EIP91_006547 [Steccherinum ochraceum]|uniref:CoA carboxyltransferase C-terminal domain-containing protein n=1 Tax=Steccherinum ochraceum TaxID=92696 RepID=A0A4R0RG61_9APHY|nr:hypothetical protein EIP91_006547 [Steccherinum ochraceum]
MAPPSSSSGTKGRDDGVSWKHSISKLRQQQNLIRTPDPSNPGYARQKENGKLWVRQRLDALLDEGSWNEIGSITGKPVVDEETGELKEFIPGNILIGWGRLSGKRVFVTADDFGVRGGHADGGIAGKVAYGETQARKAGVPIVRLLDGSSGGGSVASYLTMGATYIPALAGLAQSMDALATVPIASALLGPVVGLAAAKAVASHFSVMVRNLSQLFAAGPPVVKQATFEDLSKEALGGWDIHARNGTVDNVCNSELEAFQQIRDFLFFLPPNVYAIPSVQPSNDPASRREEELISIIPRRRARMYDIRSLIRLLVDVSSNPSSSHHSTGSSFFEIGETWGRTIVTGLARLTGRPVGILTSDCTVGGGAIDALGCQKTARFVNMCDHFNIPILNLVDQPGFAIGSAAEKAATIRHGASAMSALYSARVPIFTVVIRRAFGVAGGAFAYPEDDNNNRVAWPSGDWGSLPLEGGIEAAYKRKLNDAPTPAAREKIMKDLLAQFEEVRDPMRTAHKFWVEEIIDPRDTRPMACDWIAHAYEQLLPQLAARKQAAVSFKPTYKL